MCLAYKMFVAAEICIILTHGFSIVINDENSVNLSEVDNAGNSSHHIFHQTSVHHFARHGLCGTFKGKRYFYQVLKTKLCNINWQFIANFVVDVCIEKPSTLDRWVSELFDIDGNGFISHFEKSYYRFVD